MTTVNIVKPADKHTRTVRVTIKDSRRNHKAVQYRRSTHPTRENLRERQQRQQQSEFPLPPTYRTALSAATLSSDRAWSGSARRWSETWSPRWTSGSCRGRIDDVFFVSTAAAGRRGEPGSRGAGRPGEARVLVPRGDAAEILPLLHQGLIGKIDGDGRVM